MFSQLRMTPETALSANRVSSPERSTRLSLKVKRLKPTEWSLFSSLILGNKYRFLRKWMQLDKTAKDNEKDLLKY